MWNTTHTGHLHVLGREASDRILDDVQSESNESSSQCPDAECSDGNPLIRNSLSKIRLGIVVVGAVLLLVFGVFVVAVSHKPHWLRSFDGNTQDQKTHLQMKAGAAPTCSVIEIDVDYQMGQDYKQAKDVINKEACCALCTNDEGCGAWTYGEILGVPGLTHMCFLKAWDDGAMQKVIKKGVVSGLPPRTANKADANVKPKPMEADPAHSKCPGTVNVAGMGKVSLITTGDNLPGSSPGMVEVIDGKTVTPHHWARTYWGQSCTPGPYKPEEYAKVFLLGKTISYTTDISGLGCGCNAAFYLTSMAQSTSPGKCNDYHCDAMSICGLACTEIDLQEGNMFAWFSTLHAYHSYYSSDKLGRMVGYGGNDKVPTCRYWTKNEYGPGARCIDTNKAFQVSVSFHTDPQGKLNNFVVLLSQQGKPCNVSASIKDYEIAWPNIPVMHGMDEITDALKAGITPVISYWSSNQMLWLDGPGDDGKGPCQTDNSDACPEKAKFSDFSITDIR